LFPFRRILIADLSGSLDLGLLRYGARLASFSPSCVVGVAASLGEGVLGALAPAAHRLFDAQLREDLGCRVLTEPDPDDLFDEAARIVVSTGQASISYLQRRLRIGFSRAARLIDMMEMDGIVSAANNGKREVLVDQGYF